VDCAIDLLRRDILGAGRLARARRLDERGRTAHEQLLSGQEAWLGHLHCPERQRDCALSTRLPAILGAELGLPVAHLDHHASYIASWLELLKSDDRAILTAAAKAEEAASLLMRLGGIEERLSSEEDNDLEQAA
jgi:antirestriction protein ArdC